MNAINRLLRAPRAIRQQGKRLADDRRGASAIEFAMLLPLMVALYFGGAEISQGVGIDRKVTLTAGALADLAAQVTTISNSDMTNILNAAAAVMTPYTTGPLKITVTCLSIDSKGQATVSWSDTKGGTARGVGSIVTIPSALAVPSTSLILSEVSYDYKPTVGYTITGTLTLSDKMYMSPRLSTTIARTS